MCAQKHISTEEKTRPNKTPKDAELPPGVPFPPRVALSLEHKLKSHRDQVSELWEWHGAGDMGTGS